MHYYCMSRVWRCSSKIQPRREWLLESLTKSEPEAFFCLFVCYLELLMVSRGIRWSRQGHQTPLVCPDALRCAQVHKEYTSKCKTGRPCEYYSNISVTDGIDGNGELHPDVSKCGIKNILKVKRKLNVASLSSIFIHLFPSPNASGLVGTFPT